MGKRNVLQTSGNIDNSLPCPVFVQFSFEDNAILQSCHRLQFSFCNKKKFLCYINYLLNLLPVLDQPLHLANI